MASILVKEWKVGCAVWPGMEERGDVAVQPPLGDIELDKESVYQSDGPAEAVSDAEVSVSEDSEADGENKTLVVDSQKEPERGEEEPQSTSETETASDTAVQEVRKAGIDCSLLQLFKCQYFDMWLTIWYLNKYSRNAGVTDYLCNHLYSYSIHEIQFYLPQLW